MDAMDSVYESDDKNMSTKMSEEICDGSKFHLSANRRRACYNTCDSIKRRQTDWKVALLSTRNMGKGLHEVFNAVINEISQVLPILGESGS